MSKQIKLWFTLFPFSFQTIQSSASDWGAAAFGPLGPVHMCPLMCLVSLPLYPAVIRLTPVFVYRDKIRNVGFMLSKPLGRIDFPMCPGIKFKDQPDLTRLHLLLTSVNIRLHFSDILNLPNDLSSLCLPCFFRL